ncbi:VRR-NUC domain-containing protein [Microvirga sp. 17 mud 1-3]|uniref:VRR-NUC domain-containing protein n=1 Tax=Microvirga sp. 17 mud 1-3 TaxID=2082949 RepID=UPI000D6C44A7|nr:VRR-NUC domain-containing protein [Microvirga sp. 17 mud 1-3]AWM87350.1 VRR-NUC domain-containing protein [Microvirga sp. 17 mud 1-3]
MKEHAIQNTIRNALAGECLLFRANVGRAWTGDSVHKLPNGDLVIRNPRPFYTGLPPGFADTFGLATRIITPADVGTKLGVYIAGEIKTERGRVSDKQAAYLRAVNDNGGAADVWRTVDDARATVARAKGKV